MGSDPIFNNWGLTPFFTYFVNGMAVALPCATMPRRKRITSSRYIYHVLNRGAKRARLFDNPEDYLAFEQLLLNARTKFEVRILAYTLMPNHWHLLLWPRTDVGLPRFAHWVSTMHAIAWNRANGTKGYGAVYQSRFKSIPIERGPHLFTAWRYVERNALRAKLVRKAEDWRWSSLWRRTHGCDELLDQGPVELPENWPALVNQYQTESEVEDLRRALQKEQPYGSQNWRRQAFTRPGRSRLTKNVKLGSDPN